MGKVEDIVLVCLAAGDGSRLGLDYPKCLLNFDGDSLLKLELETFYRLGVRRAVICVGFKKELIVDQIWKSFNEMSITFVENPDFATTGAGHSLWLARQFWKNRPVIVIESDLLLHPGLVATLLHTDPNAGLLDGEASSTQGDITLTGFPSRLVWPSKSGIKGVVLPLFYLAAHSGLDTRLGRGEIVAPLNWIDPLNFVLTQGLPWSEIDTRDDLAKAKTLWDQELKSLYCSL